MSSQWECLATKKIGDDVSGDFASNAGMSRFNGIADFADNMESYADQTAFDANWVTNNSLVVRGNPTTNVIDFTTAELGTPLDIPCNFDLWSHGIFPSGSSWTLRLVWDITEFIHGSGANNVNATVGISDRGLNELALNQDFIALRAIIDDTTTKQFRAISGENQAINGAGGTIFDHEIAVETLYVEIKRTSVTTFEVTLFSDANWSVVIEKLKPVISGNPQNLRFITLILNDRNNSRTFNGTWDDVQFFNNTEGVGGFLPNQELVLHGDELGPITLFNPGTATKIITGADDGNWLVGGGVTVTSGTINGWFNDSTWKRAIYDMLANDAITLNDLDWTIDFEFIRTDNDNNPGLVPFVVLAPPFNSDPTNSVGLQSGFGMGYGVNGNGDGHKVFLSAIDGTGDFGNSSFNSLEPDILIAQNVVFYMRLMRVNGNAVLEVYNNSSRTTLFGKVTLDLSATTTITGLTWINSSSITVGGSLRILNGTITDIRIYNGVAGEFLPGKILDEDFSTYGDPVNPDFVDVFDSDAGWTTSNSTRVRVEEDQGFAFAMVPTSVLSHEAMAFDLGAIVNPLNNVIFTDDFSYTSQFLADTSWPSTDITKLDPFPNVFTLTIPTSGTPTENHSEHLLPTILNGNFRLRAKVVISNIISSSAVGVVGYIGLSSTNGIRLSAQDNIGMLWVIDTDVSDEEIRGFANDNANWGAGAGQITIRGSVSAETEYIEIIRTSPTALTYNIYSDAGFTVLTDTQAQVISANITGLQYAKIVEAKPSGSNAITLEFDDIEIIDNSEVISNTEWLLRFKYSLIEINQGIDNTPASILVGISDEDQGSKADNNQDGLFFHSSINAGSQVEFIGQAVDNAEPRQGPFTYEFTSITPANGNERVIYVEVGRASATEAFWKIYDDENYSNLIETSGLLTIPADIQSLKYLKIMEENNDGTANSSNDATIDDICFWNGRSTSCDSGGDVVTPTFFDDFSTYLTQPQADLAWVPQVGNQQVNITTDVLDFVTRRDGVDNRVTHDLGANNVSDTTWTIRCKYHVDPVILTSSVGSATLVQVQDTDVAQNSQNDMIGFGMQNNVGAPGNRWLLIGKNGGGTSGLADSGDGSASLLERDYYLEITRLDATNVRGRVFLNPDFTNLEFELNIVTSSANIDHRYLIVSSASDVTSWNGTLTGFIDNVQFWNNQIVENGVISPWITSDSSIFFVDPCQENFVCNFGQTATNVTAFFDIEAPLTNTWVMRFNLNITTFVADNANGTALEIGLSNSSASRIVNQDGIFLQATIDTNAGDQFFRLAFADNSLLTGSGTKFGVLPKVEKLYWEIIRESPTLVRLSMFADPNYTFLIESISTVIPSTLIDLQFVKITTSGVVTTNSGLALLDDIKIWDGTDVADSFGARRHLQFLAHSEFGITGSQDLANMRFNLDNDNNYAYSSNFNNVGDGFSTSADQIRLQSGSIVVNTNREYDAEISNFSGFEKFTNSHETDGRQLGPANVPDRSENAGKWANVITPISRISFVDQDSLSGIWGTDTEAVVFGSDD